MAGLGTLINVAGIIAGGIGGLIFRKSIKERVQNTLMCACGICVLFLGIGGAMEKMLQISDGSLSSGGTMMIVGSLAIGALVGELINIEAGIEQFGTFLKHKTGNDGDSSFVEGFVNTSFTVCIGAMAVVGSIQDGINADYSILATKAILDLIIVMIMTASLGKGCIFSAIPVALFQGGVTALSKVIEPVLTTKALDNLSLVGSILIFCVGLNLVWGKKVKVANMLPALIVAVAWAYF